MQQSALTHISTILQFIYFYLQINNLLFNRFSFLHIENPSQIHCMIVIPEMQEGKKKGTEEEEERKRE
jgi:hypothetical protein